MNDGKLSHLCQTEIAMESPDRLRELATWYREFADKAGAPDIWERRLLTAETLERAANEIDCHAGSPTSLQRNLGGLST